MAVSFQQQALVRKVIYISLIVALFTVSLLHRRLVVKEQARKLLLLEVSKGEVKLTDSAVSLALTGSRGIAVTLLWSAAIEKQKRHEWNELDLYVSAITKLQPHFITPWLFQSWNLSFNVAVECDRPRDKYFYISRGLEVLAEGERRNNPARSADNPTPAPGNPDMRQNLGFYYQLKIGNSDEKNAMRCLLEMSCIDPLERAPDRLWVDTDRGKKVQLEKFKAFCMRYPRLVRRLHEQLKNGSPEDVVRFLDENSDIPSRFEPAAGGPQQKESALKDELEQFPIMPPDNPNLKNRELSTTEHVDVFFISRNWFEYAQKPLPEPNPDPAAKADPPNPLEKRLPRYIAVQIFRSYPARAQAYIAENLESEGWFDADGWAVKKWFDKDRGPNDPEFRVGTEVKFHAQPSWESAYQKYLEYGRRNGLYLTEPQIAELNKAAELYRKKFRVQDTEIGLELRPGTPEYESFRAHNRLVYTGLYDSMTNFLEFLVQTDAERDPDTVTARKYLYQADRYRSAENEDPERAIALYEQAWQLWPRVLLAHPKFARLSTIQEDLYEAQIRNNFYVQRHRAEVFKPLVMGMAQMAIWPHPPVEEVLKSDQFVATEKISDKAASKARIIPVRNHRGVLDSLLYYDGPDAAELKMALAGLTQGAIQGGMHLTVPEHVYFQLTRPLARDTTPPKDWRVFVDADAIMRVRDRLGLNRAEKAAQKSS